MRALFGLLLLAATAGAGDRIESYRFVVATGQYVDLDTGTVLARPNVGDLAAEFRLLRLGRRFRFEPVGRTVAQAGEGARAPAGGYGRIALALERQTTSWFVVTADGRHVRVEAQAGDRNNLGAVSLHVLVNPSGTRAFPEAPGDLRATWDDGVLQVAWDGAPGRFAVVARAGESRAATTVEGGAAELAGLRPATLHRVEVRRVAADGLESAPAVGSFVTGPRRIRVGEAHFEGRWHGRGGGLDLAGPRAFVEEDPHVVFYLYGAFAAGGLVHLGRGEETYRDLRRLPTRGYRPFHHSLREGDVFAVRTEDGRYGKVMIRGDGADYRDGMIARVAFVESGGFELPARPGNVTVERRGDRFELAWSPVDGAVGYQVWIADAAELYEGEAPTCVVGDLPPDRALPLRVRAIFADGLRSEPVSFVVHTFPPRYRYGRFTLDSHGRNGWSFTDDGLVAARDSGELYISNSAGGATSLRITGEHGIGRPLRLTWGRMPVPGATDWTVADNEIETDDRDPPSQRFWVRSAEGGVASVRIVHADHPKVTFEYVYRTALWGADAAAVRDGKLVWKPVEGARDYRIRIGGRVLRTDATEIALPRLERNALHRIELYAAMEDGTESEPFVVETDTYSETYRRGEIETNAWGPNGVSLSKARAAPPGAELEFRARIAGRDRIRLSAPYGLSPADAGAFGRFPPRDAELDLVTERDLALSDLDDSVLLVRTADGGLASVSVTVAASRGRRLQLRYVVRPPLDLAQALRAIREAAPAPDAAAAQRAAALVERLGAADARVRERALAGLVRLGLKGARIVLAAREETDDPHVRGMLERWAFAVYAAELE